MNMDASIRNTLIAGAIAILILFGIFSMAIFSYPDSEEANNQTDNPTPGNQSNTSDHPTISVAAKDSSLLSRSTADYICDGVNDQVEINAALTAAASSKGEVILSEGIFNISDKISLRSNTTLRGKGEGITTLSFLVGSIDIRNPYVTLADFTFTGRGYILIGNSHMVLHNITASKLQNNNIAAFYVYCWSGAPTISDVVFENCKAIDCNRWGFVHDGEVAGAVVQNIRYYNCQAINCGRYGQYVDPSGSTRESWDVGFDIGEVVSEVRDVYYENCLAEGSWESGFHCEGGPRYYNVTLVNCVSRNNGQKEKTGSGTASYGAGYWLGRGTITLQNCISEENKRGFRIIYGGGKLINCLDNGSQTGMHINSIHDLEKINNCSFRNSPAPIFITGNIAGGVEFNNITIHSDSRQRGAGITVDYLTQHVETILISDVRIYNYDIGVLNRAFGKVKVEGITVAQTSDRCVNCDLIVPATTIL
jgi:hypothetical protein